MEVLLDTHVLVWWMEDAERLSRQAFKIVEDPENRILISAAVAWELAIKVAVGKMKPRSILERLDHVLERETFSELTITLEAAVRAGSLPLHHRDPFDRMLVAQAMGLEAPILSADAVLDRYAVERLW